MCVCVCVCVCLHGVITKNFPLSRHLPSELLWVEPSLLPAAFLQLQGSVSQLAARVVS